MNERSKKQTRACAGHFRTEETGEARRISGYFAVFNDVYEMWTGVTESIAPTAFDGALEGDIRALIDHEHRLVLGRTGPGTLRLRVDGKGLWGEIDINADDVDAMNLYARVKRGDVNQCSFGFEILDEERSINENTGEVHYTIKAVRLHEVSVCTFPAYKATGVEARAAQEKEHKKREFESWRETMRRRIGHGYAQTAADR